MFRFQSPAQMVPPLAVLLMLSGCTTASSSPGQAAISGDGQVVAHVGDQAITLEEVDKKALQAEAGEFGGMKLQQALYESRRRAIDQIVADQLIAREAKAKDLSPTALLQLEVLDKIRAVEDADVERWYRENPARVRGAPLDQVRGPIRELLQQERQQAGFDEYVDRLKSKAGVRVSLEPPRQDVEVAAHNPALGPETAPVQIIEFSDFQ